jgi:hypothetical protein|tara:strand:+ start:35 stop:364 length:330 start_codon:yes stop_codon:yes gene_type:complete
MYKLIKQRAKNMQGYFETPAAQKQLASIGRKMQDYSEDFGKVNGLGHLKEPGLHILNELSQVGGMMIRYGVIFGTTKKDFTDRDFQLIAEFMKGKYSNEYLSGLKQVKK